MSNLEPDDFPPDEIADIRRFEMIGFISPFSFGKVENAIDEPSQAPKVKGNHGDIFPKPLGIRDSPALEPLYKGGHRGQRRFQVMRDCGHKVGFEVEKFGLAKNGPDDEDGP